MNLLTEPYSQWTEAVIPKLGEAKEEWEIFTLLGDAMGLTYLANPAAHWLRRALNARRQRLLPRWIIDGMIRTGPMGDWYLSVVEGLEHRAARDASARRAARRAFGRASSREKLLTADKRIHLRSDDIAREAERILARADAADDRRVPAAVSSASRDLRSNNSWLRNVPKLMRGDRDRRLAPASRRRRPPRRRRAASGRASGAASARSKPR